MFKNGIVKKVRQVLFCKIYSHRLFGARLRLNALTSGRILNFGGDFDIPIQSLFLAWAENVSLVIASNAAPRVQFGAQELMEPNPLVEESLIIPYCVWQIRSPLERSVCLPLAGS